MQFSTSPKTFLVIVFIVLLINISYSEGRKTPEKTKVANQKAKEQRCSESKDGNCKGTRQTQSNNHNEKQQNHVGHYSPFRSSFTNHFISALNFAERIVLDFSREILSKYGGWDRSGWEMNVLEMVVKTISKDIILILQALQ